MTGSKLSFRLHHSSCYNHSSWLLSVVGIFCASFHYNVCYGRPVEIERHKPAMKLRDWLVHPYAHAAGVLLALLAAVAVVAFMVGTLEYTKTRGKLLLTALLVGGFFLTTLGGTGIPRSGLGRRLRPAAPVMALAALLLLLVGLWAGADSDGFWKAAACATVLSLGFVITGVALSRASGERVTDLFATTSASSSLFLTLMGALGITLEIKAAFFWWPFVLLFLCWLVSTAGMAIVRLWPGRKAGG